MVYAGRLGFVFEHIGREIHNTGIRDPVVFLGSVPEHLLPELRSSCKAFIFPSRREGLGLPILEAMRFGAPVITAPNSSLIEASGLLFDPDDIAGMATAIERICIDEAYRRPWITSGKEHAGRFAWSSSANQWKELINSLGNPVPGKLEG